MKKAYSKPFVIYDVTDGIGKQIFVTEVGSYVKAMKIIEAEGGTGRQFVIYQVFNGGNAPFAD
jgi:hypothetical protein